MGLDRACVESLEPRRLLSSTPSVVDVLFLYTPGALAFHGGSLPTLQARVAGAMDSANFALANSRIPAVLRTVGVEPIAYVGSNDLFTDRTRLAHPSDGFMDDAHALRNAFGADLVSLLVENSFGGGNASLPTSLAQLATGQFAFSANAVNSVLRGNLTVAHELGHNLGGGHERGNVIDPAVGPFDYSYGYRFTAQGNLYHDVMSYDPGEVVYSFANPDVLYRGEPTGKPIGHPEAADLHATFSQTTPVIAGYRPTVVVDSTGPSASLYMTRRTGRQIDVTIRYADASGVDASAFDDNDITVTTPAQFGGFTLAAGLAAIDGGAVGGPHKFVTYRAILPTDDTPTEGLVFTLKPNAVRDGAGNLSAAAGGTIASNTAHEAWWSFVAARELGAIDDPITIYESTTTDANNKWYRFTLDAPATLSVKLTGLSADASVLLARDVNGNNRYDLPDDFMTGSFNPGTADDSFSANLAAGEYFIDVFGDSDTPYALSLRAYDDAAAPTAELDASEIVAPTDQFTFNVTFRDDQEVNADRARFWAPIRLTNPFGGFYIAFPGEIDAPVNGPVRTVTYRVNAGLTLSAGDNGIYAVALEPNAPPTFDPPLAQYVSDAAGNQVTPGVLGTFRVAIGQADAEPPTVARVVAPAVQLPGGGPYDFQVIYRDNRAIDATTLDGNDIVVTGPGGFSAPATFVSAAPAPAVGGLRAATYRITPPGGSWDEFDRGTYTIALQPGQVRDQAGNPGAAGAIGAFAVAVPLPGDATGDNVVNIADFAILASNFNRVPRGFDQGDFNYDGRVNIADFSVLASRFNQGLPGGSIARGGGVAGAAVAGRWPSRPIAAPFTPASDGGPSRDVLGLAGARTEYLFI